MTARLTNQSSWNLFGKIFKIIMARESKFFFKTINPQTDLHSTVFSYNFVHD